MILEKIREDEYKLDEGSTLKKTKTGWRIIHPIKIDNKISWKNLLFGGSFSNFLITLFIFILLIFISWSYAHDTRECRYLLENPPTCELIYDNTAREAFGGEIDFEKVFGNKSNNDFDISLPSQDNDKAR